MSSKPLPIDNDNEEAIEKTLPDAKKIKGYVERILKLKEVGDNNNADIKSVYDTAADAGLDRTALKEIVKIQRKIISREHKQNVNQYCLMLNMETVYSLKPTN